ncbi:MAG: hypothetical protein LBD03_08190 [Methanobrevibacter sp.]|nr:hypothetical protein [Candidatus Methanovirga procula]
MVSNEMRNLRNEIPVVSSRARNLGKSLVPNKVRNLGDEVSVISLLKKVGCAFY